MLVVGKVVQKNCADCVHCDREAPEQFGGYWYWRCNVQYYNPVTGELVSEPQYCISINTHGQCGNWEGKDGMRV